jgi:hypothetical protein
VGRERGKKKALTLVSRALCLSADVPHHAETNPEYKGEKWAGRQKACRSWEGIRPDTYLLSVFLRSCRRP